MVYVGERETRVRPAFATSAHYPSDTSAVPQLADDFFVPRNSAQVGQQATLISREAW
jgi:hypothetical protein